jgi:hypothetical protein
MLAWNVSVVRLSQPDDSKSQQGPMEAHCAAKPIDSINLKRGLCHCVTQCRSRSRTRMCFRISLKSFGMSRCRKRAVRRDLDWCVLVIIRLPS